MKCRPNKGSDGILIAIPTKGNAVQTLHNLLVSKPGSNRPFCPPVPFLGFCSPLWVLLVPHEDREWVLLKLGYLHFARVIQEAFVPCKDGCNLDFRGVFQWGKQIVFDEISLYLPGPSRSRSECPAPVDVSGSIPLSSWWLLRAECHAARWRWGSPYPSVYPKPCPSVCTSGAARQRNRDMPLGPASFGG